MTRVMSARNASHWSSYISFTCSSNRSGMPLGRSSVGSSVSARRSTAWMRRSTSRTASTYSVSCVRSDGPSRRCRRENPRGPNRECSGSGAPVRRAGRCAAVAEQALEHDARIVLGRQRRRRRGPRQRVQVGAAVAVLALPGQEIEIDGELERRQRRALAQDRRRNLIGRDAVAHVGAFGALGMHAGEPRARAARVIAARAVVARFGLIVIQAADDHHPVAKRRQWRQNLRQLESRPLPARRPVVDAGGVPRDAVRHVDEAKTAGGTGRACRPAPTGPAPSRRAAAAPAPSPAPRRKVRRGSATLMTIMNS